jgi:hypothetical protein
MTKELGGRDPTMLIALRVIRCHGLLLRGGVRTLLAPYPNDSSWDSCHN